MRPLVVFFRSMGVVHMRVVGPGAHQPVLLGAPSLNEGELRKRLHEVETPQAPASVIFALLPWETDLFCGIPPDLDGRLVLLERKLSPRDDLPLAEWFHVPPGTQSHNTPEHREGGP